MKGLRKYLTPFAPDQSGAVGVLYELGGITVICDAGGCAGNICGFDEPRWFEGKSAVFSAGLRDMDAILGRDDMLIEKLGQAADKIDAEFTAVIGTPVPAVIGTDFRALARMAEKRTGLPSISIDTDGTSLYDKGEEKTWKALFKTFAGTGAECRKSDAGAPDDGSADSPAGLKNTASEQRAGVIGLTPLAVSDLKYPEKAVMALKAEGFDRVDCYGMGAGLDRVRNAHLVDRNIVVSPSAIAAAKFMKERYGVPYEIYDPVAREDALRISEDYQVKDSKVLICGQQVTGDTMRRVLLDKGAARVDVASWFMQPEEVTRPGDVKLLEEDDFTDLVSEGGYDIIIGDPVMKPLAGAYKGRWVEMNQFAVSGNLRNE